VTKGGVIKMKMKIKMKIKMKMKNLNGILKDGKP